MIPGNLIGNVTWKGGAGDLLDTVKIQHVSGKDSILGMKSYQQGRGAFEGTAKDGIWLDEEPPMDVYNECVIRLMTTGGILLLTFTPLDGMDEVALQFLPEEDRPPQQVESSR
jgi:phage terminase large subunit-like protein